MAPQRREPTALRPASLEHARDVFVRDPAGTSPAAQERDRDRGYDEAEGVTLEPTRDQATADFRITDKPPANCVAVLAIVQPDKLVLCVDKFILSDDPDKVKAVAAALQRGYTQAQLEPDEAAAAMNISADDVEDAAPTWTAGASTFGALKPGPGRKPLY